MISVKPKNDTPLVSCIIIFLDAEKFLAEAIDSCIAQTYNNWELFLVNDGSSDSSSLIAKDYARQYPQLIRYLEHADGQNLGKNVSRNLGIERARGDYIALLDADDVWLPEKLTEQVALMEQMPEAAMVYGRTLIWSSWTSSAGESGTVTDSFFSLGVTPNTLVEPPQLFMLLLEGWAQTPTTCNAFIRKTIIDEIGGFDDNFHDIFEDQAFFVKIELAYPVFVADNVWAKYRQHPASSYTQHVKASAQDLSKNYAARLKFLSWIEDYLEDQDFEGRRVRKFLNTRQKSIKLKLKLIQWPVIGALVTGSLKFLVWLLGRTSEIWRTILPGTVRDWLWVNIGKKMFMKL